jgi:hypothetical protein
VVDAVECAVALQPGMAKPPLAPALTTGVGFLMVAGEKRLAVQHRGVSVPPANRADLEAIRPHWSNTIICCFRKSLFETCGVAPADLPGQHLRGQFRLQFGVSGSNGAALHRNLPPSMVNRKREKTRSDQPQR